MLHSFLAIPKKKWYLFHVFEWIIVSYEGDKKSSWFIQTFFLRNSVFSLQCDVFPFFCWELPFLPFFSRKGRLRSQREQGGRAAFEGEKRQKWQFKAEKWENITLKWENRIKQEKCLDKPTRYFIIRVGNYIIHKKTWDIILYHRITNFSLYIDPTVLLRYLVYFFLRETHSLPFI